MYRNTVSKFINDWILGINQFISNDSSGNVI